MSWVEDLQRMIIGSTIEGDAPRRDYGSYMSEMARNEPRSYINLQLSDLNAPEVARNLELKRQTSPSMELIEMLKRKGIPEINRRESNPYNIRETRTYSGIGPDPRAIGSRFNILGNQ